MKKKIIIISVVLMGFIVALTSNSWAQRERGGDRRPDRGGPVEEIIEPGDPEFDRGRARDRVRDRDPGNHPRRHFNRPVKRFKPNFNHRPGYRSRHHFPKGPHYRPAYRFKPKFHRRHHYRAPYRNGPKFRPGRHRPVYRHGRPKPFHRGFKRNRHSVVNQVNNYYSNAETYSAPEDEFTASASISDTGFSVSVGVSNTN